MGGRFMAGFPFLIEWTVACSGHASMWMSSSFVVTVFTAGRYICNDTWCTQGHRHWYLDYRWPDFGVLQDSRSFSFYRRRDGLASYFEAIEGIG